MINYPHWKVIEESAGASTKWQILGYPKIVSLIPQGFDTARVLAAGIDIHDALVASVTPKGHEPIHPVYPTKQVRITLDNSSVLLEPGAMLLTKGNVDMSLDSVSEQGGFGSFLKRAATSMASGESMIKPRFSGTGEVLLEPRSDFIFLVSLKEETLICDQGLWVACDGSCQVDGHVNKLSAMMAGGEGMVMPRVQGTGTVLLQSPVPKQKIMVVELNNETLKVDGPFVMAFWGDIDFSAEKAGKGLLSSAASGEGMVNVYSGTGTLWINLAEAGCFVGG
jgi:uncharacterized protein (AIM24 family)